MYATTDMIAGLLTSRGPVAVAVDVAGVVVVSTADARVPDTGIYVGRIRVAHGFTSDRRASVIRRRSDPTTQTVAGAANGEFPDAIDAAIRGQR
jgi:hypothetical protein